MIAVAMSYFKDAKGVWHQPGNRDDFEPTEARELASKGFIKIIETMAVEQPETRVINYRRKRA